MKLVREEILVAAGIRGSSPQLSVVLSEIRTSVRDVHWPPGSGSFTIHPESGKKRGQGNGVVPIQRSFVDHLLAQGGWKPQAPFPITTPKGERGFGAMDASKVVEGDIFCVEWETGNISSSHRTVNKLCVGLLGRAIAAGVLVIPTARMARYLTDRIGTLEELSPYFSYWRKQPIEDGALVVMAVEHDAESVDVPRIRKGTDGWAQT